MAITSLLTLGLGGFDPLMTRSITSFGGLSLIILVVGLVVLAVAGTLTALQKWGVGGDIQSTNSNPVGTMTQTAPPSIAEESTAHGDQLRNLPAASAPPDDPDTLRKELVDFGYENPRGVLDLLVARVAPVSERIHIAAASVPIQGGPAAATDSSSSPQVPAVVDAADENDESLPQDASFDVAPLIEDTEEHYVEDSGTVTSDVEAADWHAEDVREEPSSDDSASADSQETDLPPEVNRIPYTEVFPDLDPPV